MQELTLSLDVSTSSTGWAVYNGLDLVESGVIKPKGTFLERALQMAITLRDIQPEAIKKYNKPFESIAMIKIGIATGIILSRLIADRVYFINVRSWRKHFEIKGKGKKVLKQQAIDLVADKFKKNVKDDEADAILIGQYFIEMYDFRDGFDNHLLGR